MMHPENLKKGQKVAVIRDYNLETSTDKRVDYTGLPFEVLHVNTPFVAVSPVKNQRLVLALDLRSVTLTKVDTQYWNAFDRFYNSQWESEVTEALDGICPCCGGVFKPEVVQEHEVFRCQDCGALCGKAS